MEKISVTLSEKSEKSLNSLDEQNFFILLKSLLKISFRSFRLLKITIIGMLKVGRTNSELSALIKELGTVTYSHMLEGKTVHDNPKGLDLVKKIQEVELQLGDLEESLFQVGKKRS